MNQEGRKKNYFLKDGTRTLLFSFLSQYFRYVNLPLAEEAILLNPRNQNVFVSIKTKNRAGTRGLDGNRTQTFIVFSTLKTKKHKRKPKKISSLYSYVDRSKRRLKLSVVLHEEQVLRAIVVVGGGPVCLAGYVRVVGENAGEINIARVAHGKFLASILVLMGIFE